MAHIKLGLVLGGGGARGLAHIGIIKVLEKHNIPITLKKACLDSVSYTMVMVTQDDHRD